MCAVKMREGRRVRDGKTSTSSARHIVLEAFETLARRQHLPLHSDSAAKDHLVSRPWSCLRVIGRSGSCNISFKTRGRSVAAIPPRRYSVAQTWTRPEQDAGKLHSLAQIASDTDQGAGRPAIAHRWSHEDSVDTVDTAATADTALDSDRFPHPPQNPPAIEAGVGVGVAVEADASPVTATALAGLTELR